MYSYTENDPLNYVDSLGLFGIQDVSNFSAGFGDTISFGMTGCIRRHWERNIDGWKDTTNTSSNPYRVGELSGAVWQIADGGGFLLRPFTRSPQLISHWGGNINPNVWVMTGEGNLRNWLMGGATGKLKNVATATVSKEFLQYPKGIEKFKGLFGQRIYTGPPIR